MEDIILLIFRTQSLEIFTRPLCGIDYCIMQFTEFYIHTLTKNSFLIHILVEK